MSKLLIPSFSQFKLAIKSFSRNQVLSNNVNKPLLTQIRHFSGPQEPPDHRKPEDVDPDWWDAHHWEKVIEDIQFEIDNYDPDWSIMGVDELKYDLHFAKKMFEWRKLEEPKYLTPDQVKELGYFESAFGFVGYKQRSELDYRVIGGRGGHDTGRSFYDNRHLYGPFGTEENPILVPSRGRYRFVGCLGGYNSGQEHQLAWFALRQGPKHRCPLCGQIFQLWTTDSSHKDHPYHDPNTDYETQKTNMMMDHHH